MPGSIALHVSLIADTIPDTTFQRFLRGRPMVDPPLPGGVAQLFRTMFNAPAWVWVTLIVVSIVTAAVVGRLAWRNRVALRTWLTGQHRAAKYAMGGAIVLVVGVVALTGAASWNYMQHENAFCSSCHVMEGPWNKFAVDAGKHSKLECHNCHQQSIYASTRQLVLWVANRPGEIPKHAKVPNDRCETCHNTDKDELWTRVKQTAGHRTHLESDSSALAKVMCVTCHGEEVHAFIPAKETCGSSGCHEGLKITLGKMAAQTALHCNQCHQFTAEVPRLATRDSAAGTMRPGKPQCLGCHEMQRVLTGYIPEREPHQSVCGTCHNPHKQDTPQDAGKSCTTSGCHANWRETPFHTGTSHRKVSADCLTCHQPHAAKVDPSDCVTCHAEVRQRSLERGRRLQPPLPFDTTRALRVGSVQPDTSTEAPTRGKGDAPPPDTPPPDAPPPAGSERTTADTFPHRRHTSLSCIACHVSPNAQRGGRLTFERPRGCTICHHQAPQTNDCSRCHAATGLAVSRTLDIGVTTQGKTPRMRPVLFAHPTHADRRCVECHATAVSLAPTTPARECKSCHGDHHTAARRCADCHTTPVLRTSHASDVRASHQRCDACHAASVVARLTPDRSFCLTCHALEQSRHYVARECTACHMLTSPDAYRPKLLGAAPR